MHKILQEAVTFDDVLIVPQKANINFKDISLKTSLTKTITLNTPIVSAPMDTVTQSRMAISLARYGGLGIIHKNMPIAEQAMEVDKVKRSEFGVIKTPFFLGPNQYVYEALELMARYRISGVPITEYGKLVGIVTNRDLRFETNHNKKIYEVMTRDNLITAPVGTTPEEAKIIFEKHKVEKLLIVDKQGDLKGLISIKDITKSIEYPNSAKDEHGSLLVGAAVGLFDDMFERIDALVEKSVDIIVLDFPHGHCDLMINSIKEIKKLHPGLPLIAGNVVTKEAAEDLILAGADAIKAGIGSGAVSATGVAAGVGMPQLTAVYNCALGAKPYNVPVVADGGIRESGDIVKAIIAGANAVMMGYMFAGCDESPGDLEYYRGRKYKKYHGQNFMAKFMPDSDCVLSDGVEGRVDYKGPVKEVIQNIINNLKVGMIYSGVNTIEDLMDKGCFVKITPTGFSENLPHGIDITKELNYR